MSEKPNVTVIYQEAKSPAPGLGAILIELVVFVLFVCLVGLVVGAGLI